MEKDVEKYAGENTRRMKKFYNEWVRIEASCTRNAIKK